MSKKVKDQPKVKSKGNKIDRNNLLFTTIVEAIQDKKGEEIISLDLREIDEAVADFFILCEVQTPIQMNAITLNVLDKVHKVCGEKPYHSEEGQAWTLIDYVNIVVHIFQRDERKFYDLEGLWLDAEKEEH